MGPERGKGLPGASTCDPPPPTGRKWLGMEVWVWARAGGGVWVLMGGLWRPGCWGVKMGGGWSPSLYEGQSGRDLGPNAWTSEEWKAWNQPRLGSPELLRGWEWLPGLQGSGSGEAGAGAPRSQVVLLPRRPAAQGLPAGCGGRTELGSQLAETQPRVVRVPAAGREEAGAPDSPACGGVVGRTSAPVGKGDQEPGQQGPWGREG